MVVKNSKAATASHKKKQQEPLKLVYLILLIGYGFVTVLTPNLKALDSNGPKFLSLAMFNLATFLILFTRKEFKFRPEWYFSFFKNGLGLVYCGLMIVSLLSFFKAYNLLESVLHFSKIFTTFSAAYLVSILVLADRRNIKYLCVAMTLLLIYDSWTVSIEVMNYIGGKRGSVFDITLGYSNKNILASSIFVKIPFALFLIFFNRQWIKALGLIGTLMAITATFFLSTRAFYLGTITLTIALLLYFGIRFKLSQDKYQLKLAGIYFLLVIGSYFIFTATEHYLYPKADAKSLSIEARLSTITDPGGGGRLDGWKRSWHVFKENPLLGVGLGNWKIATLKEENLTLEDGSAVNYKAHNDFIETATETGIFGGALFILLFLLIGWIFIRILIRKDYSDWLQWLFLPSLGLFCYSFDAFFNFPQDRPEMGALFALYLGIAISLTTLFADELIKESLINPGELKFHLRPIRPLHQILSFSNKIRIFNRQYFRLSMIILFGVSLSISCNILFLNFTSLKLQALVDLELKTGKLTLPANMFINEFTVIPDIDIFDRPIVAIKARYLINEKRNDEAIALLKKNKSNPFDDLSPSFIALAYNNQNNTDSSIYYIRKAYNISPNKFKTVSFFCSLLCQKGLIKESEVIIEGYLKKIKVNKEAWLYASELYRTTGNIQKATSAIDSAAHYFPADSLILKKKSTISQNAIFLKNKTLLDSANNAYKSEKYAEAIRLYTRLLVKEPTLYGILNDRALCYYFLKEYAKSIKDIEFLISIKFKVPKNTHNFYNLLGSNYYMLGKIDEACSNFKIAADMGDKDGLDNYSKHCQSGKK